ncbi:MAG: metal ABC transporter permease [Gemmatimonadota bacterium]|nr:metal ABC transporter permease [Gemmatimonadota bacterium]
MTHIRLEIQLIALVTAIACALPGAFLMLRRISMLSDAISHAVLPGIVIAFFFTGNLNSPLLILAAAASGIITAALIELLSRTRRVGQDAAIGLVFPSLFSIGVILIARYASDVHLDVDAVLLGELAFAPFDRIVLGGTDIGPRALWVTGTILAINVSFVLVFFKELKLSTFDPALAATLGFSPVLLHYLLMAVVSVTAVGAFDAVGSVLVVAFIIGPPAAAFLLTDRLSMLLVLSAGIGACAAVGGYWLAFLLDASIAGSMASCVGLLFLLSLTFAPRHGMVAAARHRKLQRRQFTRQMLLVHLLHHEGSPEEEIECRCDHLCEHLRWDSRTSSRVIRSALHDHLIEQNGEKLLLTRAGRSTAREALSGTVPAGSLV